MYVCVSLQLPLCDVSCVVCSEPCTSEAFLWAYQPPNSLQAQLLRMQSPQNAPEQRPPHAAGFEQDGIVFYHQETKPVHRPLPPAARFNMHGVT